MTQGCEGKPKGEVSDRYLDGAGQEYHRAHFRDDEAGVYYISRKFARFVSPDSVVLDFGAGAGHALRGLECRTAIAVEPNPASREFLRRVGITRVFDSLDAVPDGSVDVAITNHVLEHVRRPVEAVTELAKKVVPGGLLILCVPVDDWRRQRRYRQGDPDHHLFTWTPQLLGNLLEEAGAIERATGVSIGLVRRTRPGRFTGPAFRGLPEIGFRVVCFLWSILTRRREIVAVIRLR